MLIFLWHRDQDQDFIRARNLRKRVHICICLFCIFWLLFSRLQDLSFAISSVNKFFALFLVTLIDTTRDNDWTCPKCGNVNFSFRTVCNMRKCNTPKPGSQVCAAFLTSRLHSVRYRIKAGRLKLQNASGVLCDR